jgi:hypothetical protein
MLREDPVSLFEVIHVLSLTSKGNVCRVGSEAWKATRERPDSPDLILHIELGVPPGERGGLGRPVTKHEEPSTHKLA